MRAVGGPAGGGPPLQPRSGQDPLECVVKGPQGIGTIGATVEDGRVTEGIVSESREENGFTTPEAPPLTGTRSRLPRPPVTSLRRAAPGSRPSPPGPTAPG